MKVLLLAVLAAAGAEWVHPQGLPEGHNGGFAERLTQPAGGKKPHILMLLFDDFGWADAGWHRNYTAPGGEHVPFIVPGFPPHGPLIECTIGRPVAFSASEKILYRA